jgi:hypothetical protein
MLFGMVSATRMKIGAVSDVYVTLVAQYLVHIASMCLGALPFAD